MPLYDINSFKQMEVPQWAKGIIEEKYPSFKKDGMRIINTPERMKTVLTVPFNRPDIEPKPKPQVPSPNGRKARGMYTHGDVVYHVQYSTQPPRVDRQGIMTFIYPANNFELSAGRKVDKTDWAAMFYLEFLCPHIKGNSCQNPSSSPFWQFEMKQAEAASKIQRARKEKDLEQLVYFNATEESVYAAFKGLNLKSQPSIDESRVYLHDKIAKGSELFKTNALAILKTKGEVSTEEKTTPQETESELLNRLLENVTIKFEEGAWYKKDKRGAGDKWLGKPFYEDSGMDKETAFFNLVNHLKVNSKMLEDLKK